MSNPPVHRWQVEIETRRGDYVESRSRVSAVALDPRGKALLVAGEPSLPVFWRSAAKFIQALSLFTSGALTRFGFTDAELALACASHSGGDEHVAIVRQMLEKIGATEADLHCGPHSPLGEAQARALASRGPVLGRPTKLHNNCSGKHAGMLASCRAHGFPIADYNRLHHPLQQEILAHFAQVTALPREQIQTAVDGCGAVVFRSPLDALARAYVRLCTDELPAPHRDSGRRIRAAVAAAPELIAGPLRLCTDLSRVTGGRVFGKIGAEGVYGLGVESGPHGPAGLAVKIEDGNGKLLGPLLCALLARLGWLRSEELLGLAAHASLPIRNHQDERVGEIRVQIGEL